MKMLAKDRGLDIDPDPIILNGAEEIAQALRSKYIDAIALPVNEYWKVRKEVDPRVFIGSSHEGRITEKYVLLVHQDSGINRIEDLRGRSVKFWKNSRMSLSSAWLDITLLSEGCPRVAEFCRVTRDSKLSNVVLPVFFRQSDACVVTRSGFEAMSELNPQVSQRLKVLAASVELVTSGFCFRRDYHGPLHETVVTEMKQLVATPAGRQVQTLFQFGSLESIPVSCLDSALELLTTHERLCGETNGVKAIKPGLARSVAKGETAQ